MDFGRQVEVENQAKIDPKRHRKSDEGSGEILGGPGWMSLNINVFHDFGGFWEARWKRKSDKIRSKKASKK